MKWDASTDRLILLAILESHNITVNYEAVARNIGNGCTPRAVYTQLLKLRKLASENKERAISHQALMKNRGAAVMKGKNGKWSFSNDDDDEEIEDIKPRPFLQKKIKTEQREETEIEKESQNVIISQRKTKTEKAVVIKKEPGSQ